MDPVTKASKVFRPKKTNNRGSKSDSTLGKLSKTSCESILGRLAQLDLAKFCPKKIFFIFFVTEENETAASLLKGLIKINQDFEELSLIKFITKDEVLDLMNLKDPGAFPNVLKPLLLNFIENIKLQSEENDPTTFESQLIKLKLIQVMYEQYANEVKRNEKERNLENTLNMLSKECKKKQKKEDSPRKQEVEEKNKSLPKDDSKKKARTDKTKEQITEEDLDYTTIPVEKDEISYDENIFDFIGYYCLTGFYNVSVIKDLIDLLKVPILGIIKFSTSDKEHPSEAVKLFWNDIQKSFYLNTFLQSPLESTILMEFSPADERNSVQTLEEFLFILRRVVNLLLNYRNYLRNLKINKIIHEYIPTPLRCMYHYEKSMKNISPECVNTAIILDGILSEVKHILDPYIISRTPSDSLLGNISSKSLRCFDPMYDLNAFSSESHRLGSKPTVAKSINDFLVDAEDEMTKLMKSYKYIGPKIAETTLNMLKLLPPLKALEDYKPQDDVLHLHDVNPAYSNFDIIKKDDQLNNFLYTFLFNKFSSEKPLPKDNPNYELMHNITTFDIRNFIKGCQINIESESINSEDNLYDRSVVHFRWKRKLGRDQLLQKIHTAFNVFLYIDRKYSPETDDFLLVFSDKLDKFGTNTKHFNKSIRTPICLRDFCRYILIEDASWITDNLIKIDETTYKPVLDEVCLGTRKIKTQLNFFYEFAFLLDENLKEDMDQHIVQVEGEHISNSSTSNDLKSPSFIDIIKNLQNIPLQNSICLDCEQFRNDNKLFAYDLGNNIFKISGKITKFVSHDCASLTIDNTGLQHLPLKCKFTISSYDNVLTVFSKESLALSSEPFITTLRLHDETRISFMIRKIKKINLEKQELSKTDEVIINNKEADESEIFISASNSQNILLNENHLPSESQANKWRTSETSIEEPENNPVLVYCVDEDYVKDLVECNNLDEISANESYEEFLEAVMTADEGSDKIYKVTPKTNYLKRRNEVLKVPMETAFKNILSFTKVANSDLKHYKTYSKRFESLYKPECELDGTVDFRICLPNGLYIRSHPCAVDQKLHMIKQEYADKKPDIAEIQHEEFRLFTNQGLILIKKINGCISIYKANGDILEFKKTTDASAESTSAHECHCSTINDYRKKLNKILKNQDNCDFTTSRRGHIKSKHNHIFDKKILKLLEEFDVPYIKKSLTKFDGKRIKIQGDKISQKQLYHMTSQQDFFTGEILFERDDDFHSIFEKTGSQKCIFPDGTIISSSITDQLIDDYVFVELSYHYEHSYYATVNFNFDKTFEVHLSNKAILKENPNNDGFLVTMPKRVSVLAKSEQIVFEKACDNCQGRYMARFDISSFTNMAWNPKNEFLQVTDSYDKQFFSDFLGNCTRNSSYVTGSLNVFKCNHFVESKYKELFVANKNLNGVMLYTNDQVKCVLNDLDKMPNSFLETYSNMSNENVVTDCRVKYYRSFTDRFYNSIDNFSKYLKHFSLPKQVYYTEFQVFERMYQSADDISSHLANIQQIFSNNTLNESISSDISKLVDVLELYYRTHQQEVADDKLDKESRRRKHSPEESDRKLHSRGCGCGCHQEKVPIQEKMTKLRRSCAIYRQMIRNKEIPSYFRSAFCEVLK